MSNQHHDGCQSPGIRKGTLTGTLIGLGYHRLRLLTGVRGALSMQLILESLALICECHIC